MDKPIKHYRIDSGGMWECPDIAYEWIRAANSKIEELTKQKESSEIDDRQSPGF